jgi:serine/threonine protein kinase
MCSAKLSNFDIVKVIGKGGFSKVMEVRRKSDGLIFALKCMNKQWIKKDDKVN